jgi:hypothetical protein
VHARACVCAGVCDHPGNEVMKSFNVNSRFVFVSSSSAAAAEAVVADSTPSCPCASHLLSTSFSSLPTVPRAPISCFSPGAANEKPSSVAASSNISRSSARDRCSYTVFSRLSILRQSSTSLKVVACSLATARNISIYVLYVRCLRLGCMYVCVNGCVRARMLLHYVCVCIMRERVCHAYYHPHKRRDVSIQAPIPCRVY